MTKIELKHISKTIHKNEVLHDISFMMESGKIYGFQGVNGSGTPDKYLVEWLKPNHIIKIKKTAGTDDRK